MSFAVDLFGAPAASRGAMGSHQSASGGSDEWLSPTQIITACGDFDLDPCSPVRRPWDTAAKHYSLKDDGLQQEWEGRVWLNPPYSQASTWMGRLADHGQGTALIFARTETRMWFQHVWPKASALLFIRGRLHFHYPDGKVASENSGAPSVLVAYGKRDAEILSAAPITGHYVPLGNVPNVMTSENIRVRP